MKPCNALIISFFIAGIAATAVQSSDIPRPPDPAMATKIDWIWENKIKSWTTRERNTFIDQLFADAAMGTFRVCVRWESDSVVTPTKRDQIESMLSRHMGQWTTCLKGFDGWPWDTVSVKVIGWAVANRNTLDWSDGDSPARVYVNVLDGNAPSCDRNCSRAAHTDRTYTYPNCDGGADNHWDFYSWQKQGIGMTGFGGPAGQQTDAGMTLRSTTGQLHIVLHEMGHGFTLPDFYDDDVPGGDPVCVMNAGTAMNVTDYDRWMLRRIWSEIKRTSGRIPDVATIAAAQPARQIRQFSVFAENGMLRIDGMDRVNKAVQIRVFDLSGKMLTSATLSRNMNTTIQFNGAGRISRGTYIVRISGNSIHEVHRITVAK
ncbi:MAG: T9SS type A sorting domain-containing protein [Chitinispirillaceae bacterium]|nr:T9SS type A sorting domain-containing protein [Chitinispirillaceae bacterium]